MRLLVTNDDGIDSVFLHELVRALVAAGHAVAVAAPRIEQSWTSSSKSRHRPVRSERAERGFGCPTWTVDGTPCDCVNIAIAHLLTERPEAVVSGINVGPNVSLGLILGSGTVAAAGEGALHGLPGIALSQSLQPAVYDALKERGGVPDAALVQLVRDSAGRAAALLPGLAAQTPPRGFVVHNVNFPHPCPPDAEVRRTVPARIWNVGLFGPQGPDGHHLVYRIGGRQDKPEGSLTDLEALQAGFISHTVLDFASLGSI